MELSLDLHFVSEVTVIDAMFLSYNLTSTDPDLIRHGRLAMLEISLVGLLVG